MKPLNDDGQGTVITIIGPLVPLFEEIVPGPGVEIKITGTKSCLFCTFLKKMVKQAFHFLHTRKQQSHYLCLHCGETLMYVNGLMNMQMRLAEVKKEIKTPERLSKTTTVCSISSFCNESNRK